MLKYARSRIKRKSVYWKSELQMSGPRALSCYDWQKIMVFCWRKGCKLLPWDFVRRPTRNYGDLRSQSRPTVACENICFSSLFAAGEKRMFSQARPTVDRVKSISFHLGIKFTFFVVLDTSQSIKRKLSWGRYWGWGNRLLVYFASDWLTPGAYYPTPITPNNLTPGKKSNFQFHREHNTTRVEGLELWVLRAISGLLEERFALGR